MILNILTPTMILIKSIEVSNKYNWEFQSHYRSDFNKKRLQRDYCTDEYFNPIIGLILTYYLFYNLQ